MMPSLGPTCTLVIDIGKSHAKLLIVDEQGELVEQHVRGNASVMSPLGYPALDLQGLAVWVVSTLACSFNTRRCAHAIASTHGAAVVALGDHGVAWQPLDYEFDPFAGRQEVPGLASRHGLSHAYALARDPFTDTLAPDLPAGLNVGRQLYWMQHSHPQAWARTRSLLPYPQYWAWWLSGERASEYTSLGCHTQLWRPHAACFSRLAQSQGWDDLFAPMRAAWDALGPVRDDLARTCGLPAECQVHVGVHDSNACLARYLKPGSLPDTDPPAATSALTLVSSGTWTVLMAPGAPLAALDPEFDMLANVDVLGRATPTARFRGGRDFSALLEGAAPDAGSVADVQHLIDAGIRALPTPANAPADDGPWVQRNGHRLHGALSGRFTPGQRSALAALYCAQMTSARVRRMWRASSLNFHSLVVEGPLTRNSLYLGLLQALLPDHHCMASTDPLEGTARGAAALCRWTQVSGPDPGLKPVVACHVAGLHDYHRAWLGQC